MSINSDNILALANTLSAEPDETSWRSSASRCYYSAYHLTKSVVDNSADKSYFELGVGTHGKLIEKFIHWPTSNPDNKRIGKGVAYILQDMKRTREIADYELDYDFPQGEALVLFGQVQLLATHLARIFPPVDGAEVTS